MKARRQALILEMLGREPVRNQEQLRRGLKAQGADVTQATLSRDIKELGLVKRASDGAYQRSSAVVPGSDILIQGALGTGLVRELARIHGVAVRELDVEALLSRLGTE